MGEGVVKREDGTIDVALTTSTKKRRAATTCAFQTHSNQFQPSLTPYSHAIIVSEAMMPIHIFTQHCGSSMIIIIELPSFALFKLWGLSSCDSKSIVNIFVNSIHLLL